MPTAVELTGFLQNILKLDAIDNPFAQWAFPLLDSQIDPGLGALTSATTTRAFAAADRQYGFAFEAIGAGAAGLGFDLQRDAVVFNAINELTGGTNVLSNLGSGGGRGGFGDGGGSGRVADIFGGGGGSGRVADIFGGGRGAGAGGGGGAGHTADVLSGGGGGAGFGPLDVLLFQTGGALETFGADLAHLGEVRSQTQLAAVENRLNADAATLASDFSTLGTDAAAFGAALGGSAPTPVLTATIGGVTTPPSASALLGDAVYNVAASFTQLGADWGGGGGSGTQLFGGGGGAGTVLNNLHTDFATLDSNIQGLATPLANLLLPAVTPTPLT
jgi:hypothetical protein